MTIFIVVIIFSISIIIALGMLLFRAWEIRTARVVVEEPKKHIPELSFRRVEKIILFLIKHLIQWIILSSVKVWYKFTAKVRIFIQNKLPKINKFFCKKQSCSDSRKISFVERAVMESKIKIKKVKEKIKKEHEEQLKEKEVEEVDKIL